MKQDFQLRTSQKLSLSMTPQMIQSISLLSLATDELVDRIAEEVEKNPALEIVKEASYKEIQPRSQKKDSSLSKSDEYHAFLESIPSSKKSLKEHLLSQLAIQKISPEERETASCIINNLSEEGYHLVSFDELFDKKIPNHLEKMLALIQHFEPLGLGTSGVQESLLVQALADPNSTSFVIDLLKLEPEVFSQTFTPLRPHLIQRKLKELGKDVFQNISVKDIEDALDFIKNLDPHPARDFSSRETNYIIPDIKIRRASAEEKEEKGKDFIVELLKGALPELEISKSFGQFSSINKTANNKATTNKGETKNTENKNAETSKNENKEKLESKTQKEAERFVRESVQDANWFINALMQRNLTIVKAAKKIAEVQKDFFETGSLSVLKPLRMKDLADEIEVSESTISRIANNKYLVCEWGILPFKFFFSTEITTTRGESQSRESVKDKIRIILEESDKNLSDQKIADLLAEKGIKIARRTVAKYRSELDIVSSFDR